MSTIKINVNRLNCGDIYMNDQKTIFMKHAIEEAEKALEINEVPVGAIIVKNGEIIAKAFNLRETDQIATHHAEIIAINKACEKLNTWRLVGCELYVTLEPCVMCAGALILSRIDKVYFGAYDPKSGSIESVTKLLDIDKFNHIVAFEGGILEDECSQLLKKFFKNLRSKKKIDKS